MMKSKLWGIALNKSWLAASIAVFLGVSQARATSFTINDALRLGSLSVTGTIQTDGTIGALNQNNITSWDLVLTNGSLNFELHGHRVQQSGDNSVFIFFYFMGPSIFTATPTGLFFNFGDTNTITFLEWSGNGSGLQLCSIAGRCDGIASAAGVGFQSVFASIPESGNVQIATVSMPGPVVGAGLPGLVFACGGLLAWARWRRRAA